MKASSPKVMMGFVTASDQKIPIRAGDWHAMKRAMWRSLTAFEFVVRQAQEILSRCAHAEGCPGAASDAEPCSPTCPDREQRMSALVILNAAAAFAPVDARKPSGEPYTAPSREYFSEIMAQLGALQIENDVLRDALRSAGIEAPQPPSNEIQKLPQRAKEPQRLEEENPQ